MPALLQIAASSVVSIAKGAVVAKLTFVSAPISLTIGIAIYVSWKAVVATNTFWEELTNGAFAAQAYWLVHRKYQHATRSEELQELLDYMKYSFYQHLHLAAKTIDEIPVLVGKNKPQNHRVAIEERRDLALQSLLEQTTWDPRKGFYGLNPDPTGIWSDWTTMWVADHVYDKIFAYNMGTKLKDSDKDLELWPDPDHSSVEPKGIWSDGVTMWVNHAVKTQDSARRGIYPYSLNTKKRDFDKTVLGGSDTWTGIWSDGATMWVAYAANAGRNNKIGAYNLTTRRFEEDKTLELSAEHDWAQSIWSDGVTMWVASKDDDKIFAYNLSSKERDPTRDIKLLFVQNFLENRIVVDNAHPTGIWSDGTTMWVADEDDDKIYAYKLPESAAAPTPPSFRLERQASAASVRTGESFEITVRMHDVDGAGENGGISVSFPQLMDADPNLAGSVYSSAAADVKVKNYTTASSSSSNFKFYDKGDDIYHSSDPNTPVSAQHLLLEAVDSPWSTSSDNTLTLEIKPKAVPPDGKFKILVRGWICADGYTNCSREPADSDTLDQQGWYVSTLNVQVTPTTGAQCENTLDGDDIVGGSWTEDSCVSQNRAEEDDEIGAYAQYYTFTVTKQSNVTITLESTEDVYLYLLDGAGKDGTLLASNDDYEAGCTASLDSSTHSCITESLAPGAYTIEATTYYADKTGDFTLTVSGIDASTQPPSFTLYKNVSAQVVEEGESFYLQVEVKKCRARANTAACPCPSPRSPKTAEARMAILHP